MRRRPSGIRPPTLKLCKRKRYAEKQIVFIRQLMCAPSISERIARKLLAHFGGLPALQRALADLDAFPKIRRDKSCLGKAQQKHLAAYLTQPAPSSGESIVGALVRATGARRERAGAARRGMRRRVSRARAAGRPKKKHAFVSARRLDGSRCAADGVAAPRLAQAVRRSHSPDVALRQIHRPLVRTRRRRRR